MASNSVRPLKIVTSTAITVVMLIGLPLIGIIFIGGNMDDYLRFPPRPRFVCQPPFSFIAFSIIGIVNLVLLAGIAYLFKIGGPKTRTKAYRKQFAFPIWGWWGVLVMLFGWAMAWTRLPWFEAFQVHTFCVPWIGYILTVNALCIQRSGHCLLIDKAYRFLGLFPLSACFWWFFEYLNRFVQNWYYIEPDDNPVEYILSASLAFSTVLPAVLSTYRLLLTINRFNPGLSTAAPLVHIQSKIPAVLSLILSGCGLALIGVYPGILYPLVWFAPLLIITAFQRLWGFKTLFSELSTGDWRMVIAAATAALVCGFFWEMWNYYSLARWAYAIPYVDRFHIFAMPLLGYGGYLPFGLECLAIGQMAMGRKTLAPN